MHASDVNPCQYVVSTLRSCGLRDNDIVLSFARMIKKMMKSKGQSPYRKTPEEFEEALKTGPLQALYNAIYYTIHDGGKENEFGYIYEHIIWPR